MMRPKIGIEYSKCCACRQLSTDSAVCTHCNNIMANIKRDGRKFVQCADCLKMCSEELCNRCSNMHKFPNIIWSMDHSESPVTKETVKKGLCSNRRKGPSAPATKLEHKPPSTPDSYTPRYLQSTASSRGKGANRPFSSSPETVSENNEFNENPIPDRKESIKQSLQIQGSTVSKASMRNRLLKACTVGSEESPIALSTPLKRKGAHQDKQALAKKQGVDCVSTTGGSSKPKTYINKNKGRESPRPSPRSSASGVKRHTRRMNATKSKPMTPLFVDLTGPDDEEMIYLSRLNNKDRLFTYTSRHDDTGVNGVPVALADYQSLNPCVYLNDVIMDFYLKYVLWDVVSDFDRRRSHVLSTYFTTKLGQCDNKVRLTPRYRHKLVARWTRTIDLFGLDFVIIPIHHSSHWSLAIICYPGIVEAEYYNGDKRVSKEEFKRLENAIVARKVLPSSQTGLSPSENVIGAKDKNGACSTLATSANDASDALEEFSKECVDNFSVHFNAERPHRKYGGGQVIVANSSYPSEVAPSNGGESNEMMDTDEVIVVENDSMDSGVGSSLETHQGRATNWNAIFPDHETGRVQVARKNINKANLWSKQPCILLFDSLFGDSRREECKLLRDFLSEEWRKKSKGRSGDRVFSQHTFPIKFVNAPQQTNMYDCGIFVLHYVEQFYKRPVNNIAEEEIFLFDWFDGTHVNEKRSQIQELIQRLSGDNWPPPDEKKLDTTVTVETNANPTISLNSPLELNLSATKARNLTKTIILPTDQSFVSERNVLTSAENVKETSKKLTPRKSGVKMTPRMLVIKTERKPTPIVRHRRHLSFNGYDMKSAPSLLPIGLKTFKQLQTEKEKCQQADKERQMALTGNFPTTGLAKLDNVSFRIKI